MWIFDRIVIGSPKLKDIPSLRKSKIILKTMLEFSLIANKDILKEAGFSDENIRLVEIHKEFLSITKDDKYNLCIDFETKEVYPINAEK